MGFCVTGANLEAEDSTFHTSLMKSAVNGHADIVEELIRAGWWGLSSN